MFVRESFKIKIDKKLISLNKPFCLNGVDKIALLLKCFWFT